MCNTKLTDSKTKAAVREYFDGSGYCLAVANCKTISFSYEIAQYICPGGDILYSFGKSSCYALELTY